MTEQATDLTVRKTIIVEAPRERAFTVFTKEYGTWWPPDHHIGESDPEDVIMELREGGRWFEIEVRFISEGDGQTRVDLEHRGLEVHGERAETMRGALDAPDGWTLTMKRFARAAAAV